MRMKDPVPQFSYLARKTTEFGLAYVHLVEARIDGSAEEKNNDELHFFLDAYNAASAGPVMVCGGYTPESAREALEVKYKGSRVVVAFGRPFTSNPDLPFKVQKVIPLRPFEREHFYVPMEPKGYLDYAFCEEFTAAA